MLRHHSGYCVYDLCLPASSSLAACKVIQWKLHPKGSSPRQSMRRALPAHRAPPHPVHVRALYRSLRGPRQCRLRGHGHPASTALQQHRLRHRRGYPFLGYALCDLPSTLLLRRVGTRLWIARIMISWGFISAGMVFMATPHSFYLMRLLLGVAEQASYPECCSISPSGSHRTSERAPWPCS